jgi:hypothetical protein
MKQRYPLAMPALTLVQGQDLFNNNSTISATGSPLPVTLVAFAAHDLAHRLGASQRPLRGGDERRLGAFRKVGENVPGRVTVTAFLTTTC